MRGKGQNASPPLPCLPPSPPPSLRPSSPPTKGGKGPKCEDKAATHHSPSLPSLPPSLPQALLAAYEGWKDAEMRGQGRDFAWRNFLSGPTLVMVSKKGEREGGREVGREGGREGRKAEVSNFLF